MVGMDGVFLTRSPFFSTASTYLNIPVVEARRSIAPEKSKAV